MKSQHSVSLANSLNASLQSGQNTPVVPPGIIIFEGLLLQSYSEVLLGPESVDCLLLSYSWRCVTLHSALTALLYQDVN